MKTLIFLLLISSNVFSYDISDQSRQKILMGFECCYNDSIIEKVKGKRSFQILEKKYLNLPFKEPASRSTWITMWTLQALDIYSTHKAMRYDCVRELNPLLPEQPEIIEMIGLKFVVLYPLINYTNSITVIGDEELIPMIMISGAVVQNNMKVLERAQNNCNLR